MLKPLANLERSSESSKPHNLGRSRALQIVERHLFGYEGMLSRYELVGVEQSLIRRSPSYAVDY